MESLEKLPNIGAILADRLRDAGVCDAAELRRLGAAAAFAKIRAELPADASGHTLFALEGAIRGTRWTSIPQEERATLASRVFDETAYGR
jgi:DNA transformation protein and related proteins